MTSSDDPKDNSKPKRRIRYKGTHPRKFHEKYKELAPNQYVEDIEKIKSRGATPAGTHRPICVNEILEILNPQPGNIVLDATLGYGGHSSLILQKILPGGRLIGLDQDPIELPKTELRLRAQNISGTTETIPESALIVESVNFENAFSVLRTKGVPLVDLILVDLGVSSMQIDDPSRGFSFKIDAPLDLRMNPLKGQPAAALLSRLKEKDLIKILIENADEPHAEQIAKALLKNRPTTTIKMADTIREVIKTFTPRVQKEEGDAPIRRAFQALRIAVNDEFSALDQFLDDIPRMLKRGGRVAILSFHSGEDRRVKKSFQARERLGVYSKVAPTPIRPSFEEQHSNPRSKSAKLRWAIK
ncbi:MAG: 16S rRNA (cytosine(1402)-N(4))-methyltransferase RsmH [Oligoflexia bacterium]|nr:16S rRNA (cytosine(1402)-N(4))-methyltransferase RsmH [Oligoflexia bacterium]